MGTLLYKSQISEHLQSVLDSADTRQQLIDALTGEIVSAINGVCDSILSQVTTDNALGHFLKDYIEDLKVIS